MQTIQTKVALSTAVLSANEEEDYSLTFEPATITSYFLCNPTLYQFPTRCEILLLRLLQYERNAYTGFLVKRHSSILMRPITPCDAAWFSEYSKCSNLDR